MNACVNTSDKKFKRKAKSLGIPEKYLEIIIKNYYNKVERAGRDDFDWASKEGLKFINDYLFKNKYLKVTKDLKEAVEKILKDFEGKEDTEEVFALQEILDGYSDNDNDIVKFYFTEDLKMHILIPELVTEGRSSDFSFKIKAKEESPMEKTKRQFSDIIRQAKESIKFDPATHTYYINGKKADTSVTQYVHSGESFDLKWLIPSTRIGNTADTVTREFFEGNLKKKYPNLSDRQLKDLLDDLKRLQDKFDSIYGKGQYAVITEEFPIAVNISTTDSEGNPVTKTMAGTMDMVVIDSKGDIHIYDMKTSRSGLIDAVKKGYDRQLNIYRNILKAINPDFNITSMDLIQFDVHYEEPSNVEDYTTGDQMETDEYNTDQDLWIKTEEDDNGEAVYEPITEVATYNAPRLHTVRTGSDVDVAFVPIKQEQVDLKFSQIKNLSENDKQLAKEQFGDAPVKVDVEKPLIAKQPSLYNNPIISALERNFLGNYIMNLFSHVVDDLVNDPDSAKEHYFGDALNSLDLTGLTRQEIIQAVGVGRIFSYIKEAVFNPENRDDIEDYDTMDKLSLCYNNFKELTRIGYAKLIKLEQMTIKDSYIEDIKTEDTDFDTDLDMDAEALEEKEREHWQTSVYNQSAIGSLSREIQRKFESLFQIDSEGNFIQDPYGFGLNLFVDSNTAINSIFSIIEGCDTIEEMESAMEKAAPYNQFLYSILDEIKEEPFRSMFFNNFRKEAIKYYAVHKTYEKGKVVHTIAPVNTSNAYSTIINDFIETLQTNGNPLFNVHTADGRGQVKAKSVEALRKKTVDLINDIKKKSVHTSLYRVLQSNSSAISNLLLKSGFMIGPDVLNMLIESDSRTRRYDNSKISKILGKLNYIYETLLDHKDESNYNPLEKGKGSIYNDAKSIVLTLSKYMVSSLEASSYENGKMYYTYTVPSYMDSLTNNLKNVLNNPDKFETFMNDNFRQYSWFYDKDNNIWRNHWLELLDRSQKYRDLFDHKVQLNYEGNEYKNLGRFSYTLSLMHEYHNNGGKTAWYAMPVMSNKPSSEFIKFLKYTDPDSYKETLTNLFMDSVYQEIERIKTVITRATLDDIKSIKNWDVKGPNDKWISRYNKGRLTAKDLANFKGNGAKFHFMSFLNDEIQDGTPLGKMVLNMINGKEIDSDKFLVSFSERFNSWMDDIVDSSILSYKKLGLYDKTKKGKNGKSSYKYLSEFGNSESSINDFIENYIWNSMYATMNIIELTVTDPAFFKNPTDFQKRYAQVHSPIMKFNVSATDKNGHLYSADGIERTVYLSDIIDKSEIKMNVRKIFDDYINTLQGQQKSDMKKMADLIVNSFDEINVADAQGYSSPTSYRKKMGMVGKWKDNMEEAYQRILNGDLNVDDLGVLWQPLKPFVYSQIPKESYTDAGKIKMPVQNKNSEWMLLIADAIMRGQKVNNKLSAIYDFMENSAKNNPGKGIDTVQFESAVKSGLQGVIDLNGLNTYDEVYDKLENSVYTDDDLYNEQVVQEIPFQDYGIQQENPAHLNDHFQAMGSQVRILHVSDITPGINIEVNGENYTTEQLQDHYFNLLALNIELSAEQLKKDLKLDGTKLQRNQALSDLLQDNILKDARYGVDMLNAVQVDPVTGNFTIPLNEGSLSLRVQLLIHSIVKSRINKQLVQGGPIVQTSAFGLSDDLHIRFKDKDGNILDGRDKFKSDEEYLDYLKSHGQASVAYFEVYLPVPTGEMKEALTKEDGTLMDPEEAVLKGVIDEEQLKAIGYRIPTEDKYSMLPMKIKGWMPEAAGEVIMMPKEITLLTGSDFDVDKMYIMLKNYDRISSYDYSAFRRDRFNEIRENKNLSSDEKKARKDMVNLVIDAAKNNSQDINFDEGSIEQALLLNLQENYAYTKFLPAKSLRQKNNNEIFDIQYAVLTHPDTMTKMFNPGGFDLIKKAAKISQVLRQTNKYTYQDLNKMTVKELDNILDSGKPLNLLIPTTETYFQEQNMIAAKLVGIFANNNTAHAFMSMQTISFMNVTPFTFNGERISDTSNNTLDLIKDKEGNLISKTIASFLASSVDAVKDPVLNFMNINLATVNQAMVLARLGFSANSIALFMTQPAIVEAVQEYIKQSNDGYVSMDSVLKNKIKDLAKRNNTDVKTTLKDLSRTNFTNEEMADALNDGTTDTDFLLRALMLFQILTKMGQDLNTLTFETKFNSITQAAGPSIADTIAKQSRIRLFNAKMTGFKPPFSQSALDIIDNNPLLKAFFDNTVNEGGLPEQIMKGHFQQYTNTFKQALDLLNYYGVRPMSSKSLNAMSNAYLTYKFLLNDNAEIDFSEEQRKDLIYNFPKFLKKGATKYNDKILSIMQVKGRNRRCPVPVVDAKTGKYSTDLKLELGASLEDMLNSTDNDRRNLAFSLIYYSFIRNGFAFSPKTMTNLMTTNVKQQIPGYVESLLEAGQEDYDSEADIMNFLILFLRNNYMNSNLVPIISDETADVKEDTSMSGKPVIVVSNLQTENFIKGTGDSLRAPLMVRYNKDLYLVKQGMIEKDGFVAEKISPLGNTNNFIEYDPSTDGVEMKSVLKRADEDEDTDDSDEVPASENDGTETSTDDITAEDAVSGIQDKTLKSLLYASAEESNTKKRTYFILSNVIRKIKDNTGKEFDINDDSLFGAVLKRIKNLCE